MKYLIIAFVLVAATACNWAKEKTKETVNKTGEVIGKAGAEFVNGVGKGVEKTFQNAAKISDPLTKKGLQTGKIVINNSDGASDNIITAYLIFNENISQDITVKIISPEGQEYGRVRQKVSGQKGDAHYIDFVFDSRTNIDGRGTIQFE